MEGVNKNKIFISQEDWKSLLVKQKEEIKQKAISDGIFMKAPNGVESKLNEGQWLATRTKEFKDWFGNWESNPKESSKVVDENGEPRVMYHATTKDFDVPKIGPRGEYGKGFYVTGDTEKLQEFISSGFAISKKIISTKESAKYYENSNIMPIFVNIKKPEFTNPYFDKTIFKYIFNKLNTLQSTYDGGWFKKNDFWFVYKPEQIKSAIGNNGKFNKNNPSTLE